MKHKSCYRKAHSGTTGFAACQLCIDQDVCETDYMLLDCENKDTINGSVTSLTAKGSCYFSSAMCDQAFEFCRKSYEKCQRKVV